MVDAGAIDPDQGTGSPALTVGDLTPTAFPHPVVRLEVREPTFLGSC
jgi:hypothetical protein